MKFLHGGAGVGLQPPALADLHQRVGFRRAARHHRARPVILERPAHQQLPVGQQRRGQRVAGMAGHGLSVEAETQRGVAVDQPALSNRNDVISVYLRLSARAACGWQSCGQANFQASSFAPVSRRTPRGSLNPAPPPATGGSRQCDASTLQCARARSRGCSHSHATGPAYRHRWPWAAPWWHLP
jgi:hypothetical protein